MPKHQLGYDMQRLMAEDGPDVNASLTVKAFVDRRREHEPAEQFGDKEKTEDGMHTLCINAEGNYLGNVPEELSAIISEHVAKRGVIRPKNDAAPKYVLEGTLIALSGRQGWSEGAYNAQRVAGGATGVTGIATGASGVVFLSMPLGMLGAAAMADTPATIEIGFTDLQLRRVRDNEVKPLPDVALRFTGNLPEMGHCETIYGEVDKKLKTAVERLAKQVEDTLRAWSAVR